MLHTYNTLWYKRLQKGLKERGKPRQVIIIDDPYDPRLYPEDLYSPQDRRQALADNTRFR